MKEGQLPYPGQLVRDKMAVRSACAQKVKLALGEHEVRPDAGFVGSDVSSLVHKTIQGDGGRKVYAGHHALTGKEGERKKDNGQGQKDRFHFLSKSGVKKYSGEYRAVSPLLGGHSM